MNELLEQLLQESKKNYDEMISQHENNDYRRGYYAGIFYAYLDLKNKLQPVAPVYPDDFEV